MCGIIGFSSSRERMPSLEKLNFSRDMLRHRGPDDKGYFMDEEVYLGHRRLSIIDVAVASIDERATFEI